MKPVVPLSEKLTRPSYGSSVPADVTINESLTHHTLLPQTTRNRVPTVGTYIPLTAYISALMLTFSNKRVPGHPISAATDLALPVPATSGYRMTQRAAAIFVERARYARPTMGSFTRLPRGNIGRMDYTDWLIFKFCVICVAAFVWGFWSEINGREGPGRLGKRVR